MSRKIGRVPQKEEGEEKDREEGEILHDPAQNGEKKAKLLRE